jgi:hypothetical protein
VSSHLSADNAARQANSLDHDFTADIGCKERKEKICHAMQKTPLLSALFALAISSVSCGSDLQKSSDGGAAAAAAGLADAGGPVEIRMLLDPSMPHFGKTYAEWGVAWWQWALAQPAATNPILDTTGQFCQNGQDLTSPVFFLTGNEGGTTERSQCSVPANKALFFPILNSYADDSSTRSFMTPAELQMFETVILEGITVSTLTLSVDGLSVSDLTQGKVEPTQFSYTLPTGDNLASATGHPGLSGTITPAFTAGYYVFLPPLASGAHDLHFSGDSPVPPPDFRLDVTYHLTVE